MIWPFRNRTDPPPPVAPLPGTWLAVSGSHARRLAGQARAELAPGHALAGKSFDVIAQDGASDDVLIRSKDDPQGVWLAHLRWDGGRGVSPHRYDDLHQFCADQAGEPGGPGADPWGAEGGAA